MNTKQLASLTKWLSLTETALFFFFWDKTLNEEFKTNTVVRAASIGLFYGYLMTSLVLALKVHSERLQQSISADRAPNLVEEEASADSRSALQPFLYQQVEGSDVQVATVHFTDSFTGSFTVEPHDSPLLPVAPPTARPSTMFNLLAVFWVTLWALLATVATGMLFRFDDQLIPIVAKLFLGAMASAAMAQVAQLSDTIHMARLIKAGASCSEQQKPTAASYAETIFKMLTLGVAGVSIYEGVLSEKKPFLWGLFAAGVMMFISGPVADMASRCKARPPGSAA